MRSSGSPTVCATASSGLNSSLAGCSSDKPMRVLDLDLDFFIDRVASGRRDCTDALRLLSQRRGN